eukprot:537809-Pyramimonas_sp.AAC.1
MDAPTPPCFLQNSRASTIVEGVEAAFDGLNTQGIRELARTVPYIFLSQVPDNAPSNGRALGYIHDQLQDLTTVLENPLDICA